MSNRNTHPALIVRAKGPATKGGRIALQDLLLLAKHVQAAVQRVALVLLGQADKLKPGPKPKEITSSCLLDVVALNRGSFEIRLEPPQDLFENMHLGVESIEKLVEGLESVGKADAALPTGYDTGVLRSLKDLASSIGKGITEIEIESSTQRLHHRARMTQDLRDKISRRIRGPVTKLRTIEGRLLMADFRLNAERCRIHPPMGSPVVCEFDKALEETVYEYLRSYVRVSGETREDPASGRISSIMITDIEPVYMESEELGAFSAGNFWEEKPLDQLVAEQGVSPVQRLEDIWGKGSDLWADEEDFEAFLNESKGVDSEGSEP